MSTDKMNTTSNESTSPSSSVNDANMVDEDEEEKRRKQEEQIELVVLKYLKQKGYAKALESLKQEASSTSIADMIVRIEREDALTTTDKELLNDYIDATNVQRSNRYDDLLLPRG